MSGQACLIIIRGNRSQAYARTFNFLFGQDADIALAANLSVATAQSLCTLSGGYADDGTWEDLMTDAQKQTATEIMGAFNDTSETLLADKHSSRADVLHALQQFNASGGLLLEEIQANP